MHSYWATDVKVLYKNRAKMVVPCYNCSPFSLLENLCHMWKFLTSKQYVTPNVLIYSSLVIHSFKGSFIQSVSFIRRSAVSSEYKVELQTQSCLWQFQSLGRWKKRRVLAVQTGNLKYGTMTPGLEVCAKCHLEEKKDDRVSAWLWGNSNLIIHTVTLRGFAKFI